MSRSRACAISTSADFAADGIRVWGRPAPLHLPRHLLFRILAYRLQADHWVTSMLRASACSIARSRLSRPDRVLLHRAAQSTTFAPAPFSAASGTGRCIGWRCLPTALPGTARPMPASRRSPSRSPAPAGTGQGSSACATSHAREHRIMKTGSAKAGSLRHLYPGLDRPRAGAGLQFARRPV